MKVVYDSSLSTDVIEDIEYVVGRIFDGYDIYEFDEYSLGSSSVVYRYRDLVIKIGLNVTNFLLDGDVEANLATLPDGYMLEKLRNIIRVPEVYVYNDNFVIMEYVSGTSIRNLDESIQEWVYAELVDSYVRVLEYGYLLKDLNDSNVLLDDDGLCILDFGEVILLSEFERQMYLKAARADRVDFFELNRYS